MSAFTSKYFAQITSSVATSPSASRGPQPPAASTPLTPSTPLSATSSAIASTPLTLPRRHSIYGTEDRVIFDIGARYIKSGFSGEPRPRHITRVAAGVRHQHRNQTCSEACALYGGCQGLFAPEFDDSDEGVARMAVTLRHYFGYIYSQLLLTDPKQRRVVVCENVLMPHAIKSMLTRMLFEDFMVPSVTFAPSPVLALLTADGRRTGLVVDCGYAETVVAPVYDGHVLMPFVVTTRVAGEYLAERLRGLLVRYARILKPGVDASGSQQADVVAAFTGTDDDDDMSEGERGWYEKITDAMLPDDVVEEVQTRLLFVSPFRPLMRASSSMASSRFAKSSFDADAAETESPADAEDRVFAHRFRDLGAATSCVFTFRRKDTSALATMVIPGWLRERACEVLLEDMTATCARPWDVPDADTSPGIPRAVLDALSRIQSIDVRAACAKAILIVGGLAAIPNFRGRVRQEIARQLETVREVMRTRARLTTAGVGGGCVLAVRDESAARAVPVATVVDDSGVEMVIGERLLGGWDAGNASDMAVLGGGNIAHLEPVMGLSGRFRVLEVPTGGQEDLEDVEDEDGNIVVVSVVVEELRELRQLRANENRSAIAKTVLSSRPTPSVAGSNNRQEGSAALARRRRATTAPAFAHNARTWIGASLWTATRASMPVLTTGSGLGASAGMSSLAGMGSLLGSNGMVGVGPGGQVPPAAVIGRELRREEWQRQITEVAAVLRGEQQGQEAVPGA